MRYEHYKTIAFLFSKAYLEHEILPKLRYGFTILSEKSICPHCNYFEKDDKKTEELMIFIEKEKCAADEIWVLKIEKKCDRCNSYRKERIELKYITRDEDYMITYPSRVKEEYMLTEKCKKCDSNLYKHLSESADSGSIHTICKKCGTSIANMFYD